MKTTLFWFRKGLRLHDNAALLAALDGTTRLMPVFCLDPWFVASGSVGANRLHFLLQSLDDLDRSLRAHNSRLIVLRGNPSDELPKAMKEWKIERLAFEIDTEPYAKARDAQITQAATDAGVEVVTRWGHTLCDLDALLARHPKGKPTTTYGAFLTHLDKQLKASPIALLDAPTRLPPPGAEAGSSSSSSSVPTGAELGLPAPSSAVVLRGGETAALERLEAHLAREEVPPTQQTGDRSRHLRVAAAAAADAPASHLRRSRVDHPARLLGPALRPADQDL